MSRHYSATALKKLCEEYELELLYEYSDPLNRDVKIEGCCRGIGDCTNTFIVNLRSLIDYHAFYCLECRQKIRMESIQKTNKERYNVKSTFELKEVKEKSKATNLAKLGHEYAGSSAVVRAKAKATVQAKYNVDNVFQAPAIKQKIKDTLVAKYNVEYISQVPAIRAKARATMKKRYNAEYATQCKKLLKKTIKTNLAKYNTEWSISSKSTRAKVKATNLKKYKVEHHNQNAEVAARASKTAYKAKDYVLPSGNVVRLQGFEHFCMDELLQGTTEDDIVTSRSEVPTIWYELNGKKHRHFVDFYVKSKKLCIEVKSTWTIKRDKEKIFTILEAAKKMKIKYRILVYGPKGNLIEVHK